ncbi:ABC transporter permease [Numidum massiliense]|uniref:ABC transporter permease n=1 Tax=Numidum massiliense TaxID=1522315 RepID=UPI0006D583A1|nr:ABC transporter permease [Numidum massiliense]
MIDILTSLLQNAVWYATPLMLTAIGGMFSERSGVVNIGLEGLMTIGAFSAAVTTIATGNPWIGVLAAIVAGVLFAIPHAVATISFKADQVVSGVAINFLTLGVAMYTVKSLYDAGRTPAIKGTFDTIVIPGLSDIPIIGKALFAVYPTTYIAFAAVFISYFVLFKTPFGLRLRAVGEHPRAADTMGINVVRMRYTAVLISGALAGIGGAGLSIAIGSQFSETTIAGQGFIALAALIFGKWHPFGVLGSSLFFGFAVSLALTGQVFGLSEYVPSEMLSMVPYILTILALAGFVGRAESPSALGKPYDNKGR